MGRDAPSRTTISASWVLVCDDHDELSLLADHAVVVEGSRIVEIVPAGSVAAGIDATGHLILPGFISGHTHVAGGTVTRGIIEGGRSYARPLELVEDLDNRNLDALTAHNLAELVRGGCTTQVEMSLSLRQAESYVRVASEWGVRGYPSPMVPGIGRLFEVWRRAEDQVLHDSVADTLTELASALDFGRRWNGSADDRIRPQIGVHATDTHTPETLRAVAAAADELGNGIHLHLSQGPAETETVQRLWGKRPAEWIDDFGFYEGPLFAAHLIGADLDLDPPLLRERGAVCAHCPSAGGAGGASQPWPELLAAGVRTNVGIDTHSNDHLENLKLAVLYGQARHALLAESSPRPLARPTIEDAVRAATIEPAIGLRRDDLGRIRVGAKADLVTIDVSGLHVGSGSPPPEPLHNLLYANGRCVRDVMIDGRFVVRDGALAVADEGSVVAAGGVVAAMIWNRLAEEGWFDVVAR